MSKMFFIIGSSRSGTTMLARILGRHQDVFTFQELHFFEESWSVGDVEREVTKDEARVVLLQLFSTQRDGYLNRKKNLSYSREVEGLLNKVYSEVNVVNKHHLFSAFMEYETRNNGAILSCEQTPRNVFYVNEIASLFPDARFIYITRDPRDVLLSQKNRWKRRLYAEQAIPLSVTLRQWMNYHPIVISLLWRKTNTLGVQLSERENVIHVRYEDILNEPEREVETLCRFLGMKFSPHMLDVDYIGSSLERSTSGNRGIKKNKVGKWRSSDLSNSELYLCDRLTRSTRRRLGYEDSHVPPSAGIVFFGLTLPLKVFGAFILNVGRVTNVVSALRRRL